MEKSELASSGSIGDRRSFYVLKGRNYYVTAKASNDKLGKKVTTLSCGRKTCPKNCKLRKPDPITGKIPCYGDAGYYTRTMFNRLDSESGPCRGFSGAIDWSSAMLKLSGIVNKSFRGFQIGDFPHVRERISYRAARMLELATRQFKHRWLYTHNAMGAHNLRIVRELCDKGLTANVSCDDIETAMKLYDKGIPVVVIADPSCDGVVLPNGARLKRCLSFTRGLQCGDCNLCSVPAEKRMYIITFDAHGANANLIETITGVAK